MTSEYVVLAASGPAAKYPALGDRKAGEGLILLLTPHILRDNLQVQFAYCSRRWLSPHGLANVFGRSPVVNRALWLMRRQAAISFSLFIVSFIPSRISISSLHTLVSISWLGRTKKRVGRAVLHIPFATGSPQSALASIVYAARMFKSDRAINSRWMRCSCGLSPF